MVIIGSQEVGTVVSNHLEYNHPGCMLTGIEEWGTIIHKAGCDIDIDEWEYRLFIMRDR